MAKNRKNKIRYTKLDSSASITRSGVTYNAILSTSSSTLSDPFPSLGGVGPGSAFCPMGNDNSGSPGLTLALFQVCASSSKVMQAGVGIDIGKVSSPIVHKLDNKNDKSEPGNLQPLVADTFCGARVSFVSPNSSGIAKLNDKNVDESVSAHQTIVPVPPVIRIVPGSPLLACDSRPPLASGDNSPAPITYQPAQCAATDEKPSWSSLFSTKLRNAGNYVPKKFAIVCIDVVMIPPADVIEAGTLFWKDQLVGVFLA